MTLPQSEHTALAALETFKRWTTNAPGMCLREVRTAHGIPAVHADASDAWRGATGRHPGDRNPPKGATVFYTGGSSGHGHIAISQGGGRIRSTDAGGRGRMGTVDLDWPVRNWGQKYAGWAEGYNGRVVKNGPPTYGATPPKPDPKPEPAPKPDPEDDVVTTEDIKKIAAAVWAADVRRGPSVWPAALTLENAGIDAEETRQRLVRVEKRLDQVAAAVAALVEAAKPSPSLPATLRELAVAGGFTGDAVNLAAAVAMAESGGYVDAVGDITLVSDKWGPSVGLWQIRTLVNPGAWGSEDRLRDISQLRDPLFQARAALVISKGGTEWAKWSVFTSGSYKQYLGQDYPLRTGHKNAASWTLTGKPA